MILLRLIPKYHRNDHSIGNEILILIENLISWWYLRNLNLILSGINKKRKKKPNAQARLPHVLPPQQPSSHPCSNPPSAQIRSPAPPPPPPSSSNRRLPPRPSSSRRGGRLWMHMEVNCVLRLHLRPLCRQNQKGRKRRGGAVVCWTTKKEEEDEEMKREHGSFPES